MTSAAVGDANTPWLQRRDWAEGSIVDESRRALRAAWLFAIFWNAIAWPSAVVGVRAAIAEGAKGGWVTLLFPLVGFFLLGWALRATIRYRRYGVSRLDLTTRPGSVGGTLEGVLRAPAAVQPQEGFTVTLTCLRRRTASMGRRRNTTETILWQEEQRVRGAVTRDARGMGSSVPVAFAVPADAEPYDATDRNNQVLWRLQVAAEVPGVDYAATFDVPVFRTGISDALTPAPVSAADSGPYRPTGSRIEVTTNRRGTEIYFPAARNRGMAVGTTFLLAIWTGAVAALLALDAPIVFAIVFGVVESVILYLALVLWLGVSRVRADLTGIAVASGFVRPVRERFIPRSMVADVVATIGMQRGGRAFYDVTIVRTDGREIAAGRGIRDKREAEWLAATLKEAIGPAAPGSRTR